MRVDRLIAVALCAIAPMLAPPRAATALDPAAADEAFDAGENAKALELYDQILARAPYDVHALLRSGMLLSWDRRYDEALARYDKALTIEPRDTRVKLERGKVLLWSGHYEQCRPVFASVLKDDPKEVWALVGTAQSYAWTEQPARSIPWYQRALAIQPDMKEAQFGLASAELQTGDTTKAAARVKELKAKYPDDKEIQELDRAVRRARAPWISLGFDHLDDSDDNRMTTWRLEGGFALPARLDLRFGLTRTDLHGPIPAGQPNPATDDANGSADSLYGVLGWQVAPRQRGEFRAGAIRLEDSSASTRTAAIGGVTWTFPMDTWDGRASVARDPFLYSPQILDNRIDVTSLAFGAYGPAGKHVQVETNAGAWDMSDGNRRWSADAGAWYVWHWHKNTLMVGPVVRTLNYTKDLDNGYFDPSSLLAAVLSFRSNGAVGKSAWSYEAAVEAGAQSYTFNGARTTGKPLFSAYGLLARPLTRGISFDVYAGWTNSSTASGPGFTSINYGARLRFTIGG
jgi:tetratricopeptide (TPR) repeat protein